MDKTDWVLIEALQRDGRATLSSLAKEVSLSVPAVRERVQRLEESGAIVGYAAQVDPRVLGLQLGAVIGITVDQPLKSKFKQVLAGMPEVVECLHVTGADSYLVKVFVRDIERLEAFINRINLYGETRTSIIMSTAIPARPIKRVE